MSIFCFFKRVIGVYMTVHNWVIANILVFKGLLAACKRSHWGVKGLIKTENGANRRSSCGKTEVNVECTQGSQDHLEVA